MSLAPFVRILGRGPSRSRSLTRDEASTAMALILSGAAEPEAIGALVMLMRYRGETAEEVAGFVDAIRASLPAWSGVKPALDWPSYAAGRTRGMPWFLLSAKLVASAGIPVLIHGWNSHQNPHASVRNAVGILGIGVAGNLNEARQILTRDQIAYLPLENLSPAVLELLRLREVLGLRSAINTVLRVLNPAGADATVQGVFHPSYRALQSDAGALLGQRHLTVIKGGGGEFERHPTKEMQLFGLRDGREWTGRAPALVDETRRLSEGDYQPKDLVAFWAGDLANTFVRAVVFGTAALALETVGLAEEGEGQRLAENLWHNRLSASAA